MYHINKLNQVFLKNNISPSRFSPKDLQTDYSGAIDGYIALLTKSQKKIAYYILQFRNRPWIMLKNETISLELGCSTKTVTRATNKFLKDGFIAKSQQNKYAPNNYALNQNIKKVKFSFSHWFQSLSPSNQDLYNAHGIRIDHKNRIIYSYRNVPQSKSSLILDSLFINPSPLSRTCAKGNGYKKSEKYKKGVSLVNEFQKKWIINHRTDPRVKDMLNNAQIKSALITPMIEKITNLLSLDEREQLKLIAFSDESLEYASSHIEPIISGERVLKDGVKDKMGWLIAILVGYCQKHNVKPNWKWYYDICGIIGVDPKTSNEKKPLIINQPKVVRGGIYKPWKSSEIELTFEQKYEKLTKEIEKCKTILSNPRAYFKYCMNESIKCIENSLNENLKELEELEHKKKEEGNEKKNISNQYSPNTMATCIA